MIFGPSGAGKSKLAAGIALEALRDSASILPHHISNWWSTVCYVRATQVLTMLRGRLTEKSPMAPFLTPRVLIVDDFGFENGSNWVSEQWLALLDIRNGRRFTTVVVSQFNSKAIEDIHGTPVADRLRKFKRVIMRGKDAS